jgi:hypothetical protein
MNVEIKPCPFCGKIPVIKESVLDCDCRANQWYFRRENLNSVLAEWNCRPKEWNIVVNNEDCPNVDGEYEVISDCGTTIETVSYSVIDGWDTHHWIAAWRKL